MKITKVNIPESFNDNGIGQIEMERLGKIIIIAGVNGSGKTRLFSKIKKGLEDKPTLQTLEYLEGQKRIAQGNVVGSQSKLDELRMQPPPQAQTITNSE